MDVCLYEQLPQQLARRESVRESGNHKKGAAGNESRPLPACCAERFTVFSCVEAAKLIGIADAYLWQLSLNGKGPQPATSATGRRSYTLDQINEIRAFLDENSKGKDYVPHSKIGDHCQVMPVVIFKAVQR